MEGLRVGSGVPTRILLIGDDAQTGLLIGEDKDSAGRIGTKASGAERGRAEHNSKPAKVKS